MKIPPYSFVISTGYDQPRYTFERTDLTAPDDVEVTIVDIDYDSATDENLCTVTVTLSRDLTEFEQRQHNLFPDVE